MLFFVIVTNRTHLFYFLVITNTRGVLAQRYANDIVPIFVPCEFLRMTHPILANLHPLLFEWLIIDFFFDGYHLKNSFSHDV
jgi:hypothetical protein